MVLSTNHAEDVTQRTRETVCEVIHSTLVPKQGTLGTGLPDASDLLTRKLEAKMKGIPLNPLNVITSKHVCFHHLAPWWGGHKFRQLYKHAC